VSGEPSVLRDLVITLCAAVVVLLPSRRFKIPPAVGFLITGTIIGPGALGWIRDPHHVETLAEVGVSILLFVIGLEFSLARLREIGRSLLVAGPLQTLGTIAIVAGLLLVLRVAATPQAAVFAGMLAALSSTAMLLPLLNERGEMHAPQGRLILGILLFQDFAMVPMLVLTPSLAGARGLAALSGAVLGMASAAAVFLVARFVMPRLVNAVIRSGVRELYVMMAVAICLGASLATKTMGLSPALGAFLAGILVSESEYAHQIIGEILPFRDLFTSLFFVSIGMLLIPARLVAHWPEVSAWLLLILVLKSLVAGLVVMTLGFPLRIAAVTGISLAQVGEFSFVLASVGAAHGLMRPDQEQQFLAVAVLSLALTPFLVRFGAWMGSRAAPVSSGGRPAAAVPAHAAHRDLADHVIVVGYGINGRNLARVLRETGIPYVILEVNPVLVRRARREGQPALLGDASRREALASCGLEAAAVVVLAISDPSATRVAVALIHESNPRAHVIARTRLVSEVAELMRLGADEVIPEEFETSIAIFARVLSRYHVPGNVIRLEERALRQEGYGFLREGAQARTLTDSVARMIEGATTDTFYLAPDSPAVGRRLEDLALRSRTRVLVIAVVRDGKHHLNPEPDYVFHEGDILVLVGDHAALEAAFEALSPAGAR
jgi:CPA2 family monovalent cation:H+ antiporter-2